MTDAGASEADDAPAAAAAAGSAFLGLSRFMAHARLLGEAAGVENLRCMLDALSLRARPLTHYQDSFATLSRTRRQRSENPGYKQ